MIYNLIIGVFSSFFMKLLSALINEKMLTKIFFYCARRLAKYTDTPIDDKFVEELYIAFNKDHNAENSNEHDSNTAK